MQAQVWLSAADSRRMRAIAARTGPFPGAGPRPARRPCRHGPGQRGLGPWVRPHELSRPSPSVHKALMQPYWGRVVKVPPG